MKSSDTPIMQFFSKKSTSTADEAGHDLVEEPAEDDEEDDAEEEAQVPVQEEEDSNDGITLCPVCHKMLLGDNDKINKHIDLCLDGEMVRTTIRQKDQRTSPQIHQKKRYASLLSALVHLCSSSVQSTQVKSTPPAKRKQRTLMTTKQECFSAKTNHWNRQSLLQS
jgi:hypothetical protein